MKHKLLFSLFLCSVTYLAAQNGTRPDFGRVITGSEVVRTIPVLNNDNAVAGKNYQIIDVFYSVTSPSTNININFSGANVTYKDIQGLSTNDTFFYVVKDLNSGTNDTNFVLITKDNLNYDLYPGDANKDNICNHIDVLNIGIAYGKNETTREGKFFTNDWTPVKAYNWTFSNQKSNYRYSDANGDGIVDSTGDIGTIYKNYNRTIGTTNTTYSPTGGPSFQIVTSDTFQVNSPNSHFQIKILLGSSAAILSKVYGLALTLKYDTAVIKANNILFKSSKWFIDQQNTLDFYKVNETTGEIEMCVVRKSGINNDGGGEWGVVDVVVEDELGGLSAGRNTNFELAKAVLIDSAYNLLPVTIPTPKPVHIVKKSSSGINAAIQEKPIQYSQRNNLLTLENNRNSACEVQIYNVLGKLVYQKNLSGQQAYEVNTQNWSEGIYFIKVMSETYKLIVK